MRMINAFTVHALNTFVLTFLTIAMLFCMKNLNLPGWCIFKIKMITMLYMCNKFLTHSVSSVFTINTIVANVDTCIQYYHLKAVFLQMSITDKNR